MSRPVSAQARATNTQAVRDLVAGWTDEQLAASLAADRLCSSWGLSLQQARDLVALERRKRELAALGARGAACCERVALPGGGAAIVCTTGRRARCKCGAPAPLLCDWKTPTPSAPAKTCDVPICSSCATSPAPGKDLCPDHAEAYQSWRARHEAAREAGL